MPFHVHVTKEANAESKFLKVRFWNLRFVALTNLSDLGQKRSIILNVKSQDGGFGTIICPISYQQMNKSQIKSISNGTMNQVGRQSRCQTPHTQQEEHESHDK